MGIKYLGQVRITADIIIKTGLHIGAGKDSVEIGGIDSPVVKTPQGDPYIPGSSLKGKLRSLLEWAFGKIRDDGKPWDGAGNCQSDDVILRIFGCSAGTDDWKAGPGRLLVRDAMIDSIWRDKMLDAGRELTESKTEVVIDRVAGKAGKAGARQIERVPPEAKFKFEAVFKIYDTDNDNGKRDRECLAWLIQGFDFLENDSLGGSGSRGYGQVKFENVYISGSEENKKRLDGNEVKFRDKTFSPDKPDSELEKAVDAVLGVAI